MGRAPNWQAAEERPVVVLGAGGMLATALVDVLEEQEQHYVALSEHDMDITIEGRIAAILKGLHPRVVINAAAYIDVDGAESNREIAFDVNGVGAGHVAAVAASMDAQIIHVSTDYVFNGSKESPYLPDDEVDPINVYGASKLEGERLVRESSDNHLIARTAWLYSSNGKNFVDTMLALGRTKDSLDVVDDQKGSPTFTRHLAAGIVGLMNRGAIGPYHLTNSGQCSWFEFAKEIFGQSRMDVEVNPVPTEAFPRPAPRPRNSVLDCSAAYEILGGPLPSWQEALGKYLKEIG